jgi:NADP-dependent 3-hydroxy acid dehydrogenase YdfG
MGKDIVIITGGASGLGKELVKQFIEKKYLVCNIDRDIEKMKELEYTYKENYKGFIGDISDSIFVKETIENISKIGEIKILINNAGEPSFKLPTKYEKEDIDKCFKGLEGMILFSTETLKIKQEKNLKIVNIMSSAALRGNKQEAVYIVQQSGEKEAIQKV